MTATETRYSLELIRSSNGAKGEPIACWDVATVNEGVALAKSKRGKPSDPYWGSGEHQLKIWDREAACYVDGIGLYGDGSL